MPLILWVFLSKHQMVVPISQLTAQLLKISSLQMCAACTACWEMQLPICIQQQMLIPLILFYNLFLSLLTYSSSTFGSLLDPNQQIQQWF